MPPIASYSSEDYKAENQNWAIAQGKNKFIYVANNKGLLEFNGATWRLYPSPNETIIRSLAVVGNRIYTGSYMEFGFWEPDNFGQLNYSSLSSTILDKLVSDEQFWNITAIEDWMLFQSLNRIYAYNAKTQSFNIIDSDSVLTKMVKLENEVYFQKLNQGIFKISNGKEQLISNDEVLMENYLVNIFRLKNKLLFLTQNNGFFTLEKGVVKPWDNDFNSQLDAVSVYSGIQLKNGNIAIGTISNGVIIVSLDHKIDFKINQSKGLSNNTVLSLFEDIEQNIWLGLDNGIDCLNMDSPFRIFQDDDGILGTVYAAIIHEGQLYLGTNQGLFYREYGTDKDFVFVKGTNGQVWCLKSYDGKLFIGHNLGTFILSDSNLKHINNYQGTWDIQEFTNNPSLLLQGNYNGLSILQKKDNVWSIRNKIEGFDISSKYFGFLNDSSLFVSHEYKGVYKIALGNDLERTTRVEIDFRLGKGLNSSLTVYNDDILYAYKKGVFKYDTLRAGFTRDSTLSLLFDGSNYVSGKLITDSHESRLWGFTENNVAFVTQGKMSDVPKINRVPFPNAVRKMMIGYENLLYLGDEKYLIGTSSGYIVMDLKRIKDTEYEISINSIENYSANSDKISIDKKEPQNFKNTFNNLEFYFSVPEYKKFVDAEYQYQLEGIYEKWSDWSKQPSVLFENLPSGSYTMNVRAKVGNSLSRNTASYSFSIDKSWYATHLAIAFYLIAVLLFSIFMHTIYRRYYERQRIKLVKDNQRDLELKELENEQQVMQLKNEKLLQDVDNKNRELAISTMSLIKKNEFLGNIKNELKNAVDSKGLKPVIKIIDKNINNTDDWKFFQEAFNNADKNFLKKVKELHPKLTPNDLKLCAYLRLNLTSKEIAPLLNISPRSVEVKRYRLRKKMNLGHEDGLTDYILQI